ncbi:transcriptional regulator, HxlR family [Variovorax sp. HW608]|uniref:winged helix-turn-helix transcriptional regulator n=1 Tax=Variovorax sp. HW608 TaxID=1034889 RepID=UPI00081FEA2B|nr:helix-turn-helix domain-containing protein [Variovorax sp. HW608]SCK32356.1 transcriptional regulator, HxlR family [Variovorax sp. HW608]
MRESTCYRPNAAAFSAEAVFRCLSGRWKLLIVFHLFDGKVRRFSDLERLTPGISQKMLAQQLRQLEEDGVVTRTVYQQIPPKVEYQLTEWGQLLGPALDGLLQWADCRDASVSRLASPHLEVASA